MPLPIGLRGRTKLPNIPEPPLISAPKPVTIIKDMVLTPGKHDPDFDITIATGNVDVKFSTPPDRDAEMTNGTVVDHWFVFSCQFNLSGFGFGFHKQYPF